MRRLMTILGLPLLKAQPAKVVRLRTTPHEAYHRLIENARVLLHEYPNGVRLLADWSSHYREHGTVEDTPPIANEAHMLRLVQLLELLNQEAPDLLYRAESEIAAILLRERGRRGWMDLRRTAQR